jgi:hypothetical protein
MANNDFLPKFAVNVQIKSGEWDQAHLLPATEGDMATDWGFNWLGFWERADFNCEAFITLRYKQKTQGLVRFALYPYPFPQGVPEFAEILHIEALEQQKREVTPVGFWLIWYVVQISFLYCSGDENGSLVMLDSIPQAIDYYRDKVIMDGLGWVNIAPGEEGYAFSFKEDSAKSFGKRIEREYGSPKPM